MTKSNSQWKPKIEANFRFSTLIIRSGNGAKFKVYRKPTNKDDFIHFFSAHDRRTKSGVVIRAYRICSDEFLADEMEYIRNTFIRLSYPKGLLSILKEKARNIIQKRSRLKTSDTWMCHTHT